MDLERLMACSVNKFLVIVSVVICTIPGFAVNKRVLNAAEEIRGYRFPSGTEETINDAGEPLEFRLNADVNWGTLSIQKGSIVVFSNWFEVVIPPEGMGAPLAGLTNKAGFGVLPETKAAPVTRITSDQCIDVGGSWLFSGSSNMQHPRQPISLQGMPIQRAGVFKLGTDFNSDQIFLAKDTIVGTDDGVTLSAFYSHSVARFGSYGIPPYTFVTVAPYLTTISATQQFAVNALTVQSGTDLFLDSDNEIISITIGNDRISVVPDFKVSSGTKISYQDGHLLFVRPSTASAYRGLPTLARNAVCFMPDGAANIQVSENVTVKSTVFPAGSNLIIDSDGDVVRAILSQPTEFDGLLLWRLFPNSGPRPVVTFYKDGHLRSGFLMRESVISGIHVGPGYVMFNNSGVLLDAVLSVDQTIAGVPCMGGKEVRMNDNGTPIWFYAASDWSMGATHLHRGQPFNGIADYSDVVPIFSAPDLAKAISGLQISIVDFVRPLFMQHSSQFPFGNIGRIESRDFHYDLHSDHIDLHFIVYVENMLTNPPFADCDVDLPVNLTMKWAFLEGFNEPKLAMFTSNFQLGFDQHFCPSTTIIESLALVAEFFGFLKPPELVTPSSLQKPFSRPVGDIMKEIYEILQQARTDGRVLKWSLKPVRLFIDQGGLKFEYKYTIQLR